MIANLRSGNHRKNSIFDKKSSLNRDNVFGPYIKLKESFKKFGITLNTPDMNVGQNVKFEIHMDKQNQSSSNLNYLLLYENPEIYPLNHLKNLTGYKKIFTWNDNLVDENFFLKLHIPNTVPKNCNFNPFLERNFFCSIIASYRTLPYFVANNLYKERLRTVKWFNKYHPENLQVYGDGWDSSSLPHLLNIKPLRYLFDEYYKFTRTHKFKYYQGKLDKKSEALTNSKFAICYENLSGLNGYVTEKIFDCFFSGCIRISWAAENIVGFISKNYFIDRREFSDNLSLFKYITAIDDKKFESIQNNIKSFINSPLCYKFTSEYFSDFLVKNILSDLLHDYR